MKMQNDADAIIKAYDVCKIQLAVLEKEHGYITSMQQTTDGFRLSDAVKALKDNTARWLFLNHPEIKKNLCGIHLWNPSYFVATVSDRSLKQVTDYINSQKIK